MSTAHTVAVLGAGVLAPGFDGWAEARAVLRGDQPYVFAPMRNPTPAIMPAAERRRASLAIRLALEAAQQAVTHAAQSSALTAADLGAVFTSCDGDGDTIHAVCLAIAEAGYPVSPTKFTNSVHNAPAGYWSIATGARLPSTSLCAWEGSFAAGLLEAVAQVTADDRPVVLVASDAPLPAPLAALRAVAHPFSCAVVLAPMRLAGSAALRTVAVSLGEGRATPAAVATELASNPAAAGLALLQALARDGVANVVLPYLADLAVLCEVRR